MRARVSIITPYHDAERFLPEAIRSVTAQTFIDWELLLVDDGSTDSSAIVAEEYCTHDSRIRHLRLARNVGPAIARNHAIERASGRFIAFLDADDFWHPDKLARQVEYMEREKAVLSCTAYALVNKAGEQTGTRVGIPARLSYRKMLTRNYIGCLTAVYDSHRTGKLFMPDLERRHDYGLWLNIIRKHGPAHGLDEVLAYHRRRKNSLSSNKLKLVRYNWQLMREHEGLNFPAAAWYVSRQIANRVFRP